MKYKCPECGKVVAMEGKSKKTYNLTAVGNARLVLHEKSAPKVRCSCGKSIILLKGSLS